MNIIWKAAKNYTDILYHKADGIAKITINRPEKRNAFRPETAFELYDALVDAREDASIGVVLLTGGRAAQRWEICFLRGWRSKRARSRGLRWR